MCQCVAAFRFNGNQQQTHTTDHAKSKFEVTT